MQPLPETVDWPKLVAFTTHRVGNFTVAKHVGVSTSTIEYYLAGRNSQPRFDNGLLLLEVARILKPFELQQIIGTRQMPPLPTRVAWTDIAEILKATYQPGEMISTMTEQERESYLVAVRNYKSKRAKPRWRTGAILLNLAQDRLSATAYRLLTEQESNVA